MKYIRTKDGHIYNVAISVYGLFAMSKESRVIKGIAKKDIINQADTIEELCDEFVVADGDQIATFRNLKIAKSTKGDLYGNIIVNGLSHSVAKMNKEGVFELL